MAIEPRVLGIGKFEDGPQCGPFFCLATFSNHYLCSEKHSTKLYQSLLNGFVEGNVQQKSYERPIIKLEQPKKGRFLPNNEKKPKALIFALYLYQQRKQTDLYTPINRRQHKESMAIEPRVLGIGKFEDGPQCGPFFLFLLKKLFEFDKQLLRIS